eukprot:g1544.t1
MSTKKVSSEGPTKKKTPRKRMCGRELGRGGKKKRKSEKKEDTEREDEGCGTKTQERGGCGTRTPSKRIFGAFQKYKVIAEARFPKCKVLCQNVMKCSSIDGHNGTRLRWARDGLGGATSNYLSLFAKVEEIGKVIDLKGSLTKVFFKIEAVLDDEKTCVEIANEECHLENKVKLEDFKFRIETCTGKKKFYRIRVTATIPAQNGHDKIETEGYAHVVHPQTGAKSKYISVATKRGKGFPKPDKELKCKSDCKYCKKKGTTKSATASRRNNRNGKAEQHGGATVMESGTSLRRKIEEVVKQQLAGREQEVAALRKDIAMLKRADAERKREVAALQCMDVAASTSAWFDKPINKELIDEPIARSPTFVPDDGEPEDPELAVLEAWSNELIDEALSDDDDDDEEEKEAVIMPVIGSLSPSVEDGEEEGKTLSRGYGHHQP